MKSFFHKIVTYFLGNAARRVILKFNPKVIAVTGSVGKSSTKEAVFQVLRDAFGSSVRKNYGNLNTEIGVPLAILGYEEMPGMLVWPFFLISASIKARLIKNYPKYLVLELGIDRPGDMSYLMSLAKPDIAVITSTQFAHLANFKSETEYQKEKLSILGHLKENGIAVINGDDEGSAKLGGENIRLVGRNSDKADYRAESIKLSLEGLEYRIACPGHKISVKSSLIGLQMVYSMLFAFAVGNLLGVSLLRVGKSLEKIKPLPGRMNLIEGQNRTIIIDDSYNANPASVRAALDTISQLKEEGRKVLILGNMNELGVKEEDAHRQIGRYARGKVDLAVFAGPNAPLLAQGYDEAKSVLTFSSRDELIPALSSFIKEGDIILVKASQNNNFFEEVTKALMKHPQQAEKLLVRQGREWMRKKIKKG